MRSALVLALIATMAGPVSAATLCANRKGALFIRNGCNRRETVVQADASTLNGLTAAQIEAQATSAVAAGLSAFLTSAYTRLATIVVPNAFCNTVDVACDRATDFLLSCGAAVSLTTGYLTSSTEIPGANGTCRAGGCGFGVRPPLQSLQPVCGLEAALFPRSQRDRGAPVFDVLADAHESRDGRALARS